jgi:hypothetical protein
LVGVWFGRRKLRCAGLVGARQGGGRRELRGGGLVGVRRVVIATGVVSARCEARVW